MSQGSPYQYTAADIRRYVEGKMTPAEQHAIEKAALDDPFLADAMEGYQASLPTEAAVDALKKRLGERVSPAKIVPIQPKPWLSMAAATVVLLGIAVAMWVTLDSPASKPAIAKVERTEVILEDIIQEDSLPAPEPPGPPVAATEKAAPAKIATKPSPDPPSQPPAAAPAAEPPVVVGYATKQADKVAPDAKAAELSVTRDEEAKTLRSAPPVAPKAVPLSKAKRDDPGARIYTEPADGWSAFEVYLINNIRRPKDPVLHGNVVLSFQVNPETGRPFDIKVDKSLNPLYDKEAIRLLKEGPAWAVYNTETPVKTTYTVVF